MYWRMYKAGGQLAFIENERKILPVNGVTAELPSWYAPPYLTFEDE